MTSPRSSHVVVHNSRRLEAYVRAAPIAVRTGQRHNADINAMFVHRSESQSIVEHRGNRRHERRAIEMDRAQAAADLLDGVARRSVLLEEQKPRFGETVGMDIDHRAHGFRPSHLARWLNWLRINRPLRRNP